MGIVSCVIGLLLIVVGIGGYVASDHGAPTALIPAYFGAVLALLGLLVVVRPSARKHAMHAAAAIGLLGFLAAAGRLIVGLTHGHPTSLAVFSLASMAALCGLFVALAVRSFIAARRARTVGAR